MDASGGSLSMCGRREANKQELRSTDRAEKDAVRFPAPKKDASRHLSTDLPRAAWWDQGVTTVRPGATRLHRFLLFKARNCKEGDVSRKALRASGRPQVALLGPASALPTSASSRSERLDLHVASVLFHLELAV